MTVYAGDDVVVISTGFNSKVTVHGGEDVIVKSTRNRSKLYGTYREAMHVDQIGKYANVDLKRGDPPAKPLKNHDSIQQIFQKMKNLPAQQ